MMRRLQTGIYQATAIATALVALGQPGQAADSPETLNDQGVELRRRGEYARALETFQRAHAAAPTPKTLAQIGLAELDLHRWVDAKSHLASALERADFPWIRKNRQYLEPALESARAHIGQLLVRGPEGASLSVNGRPRGPLPLAAALDLDEGEASVTVSRERSRPWSTTVTIHAHTVAVINSVLVAPPAPILDSQTEDSRQQVPADGQSQEGARSASSTARHVGVALIGVGIGAGAAGVLLLRNRGEDCGAIPGAECNLEPRSSLPGWSLVGAGLAAVATGAFLVIVNRDLSVSAAPSSHALTISIGGTL
jgi:hypothetical protein